MVSGIIASVSATIVIALPWRWMSWARCAARCPNTGRAVAVQAHHIAGGTAFARMVGMVANGYQ
jgi:hypothetical protein